MTEELGSGCAIVSVDQVRSGGLGWLLRHRTGPAGCRGPGRRVGRGHRRRRSPAPRTCSSPFPAAAGVRRPIGRRARQPDPHRGRGSRGDDRSASAPVTSRLAAGSARRGCRTTCRGHCSRRLTRRPRRSPTACSPTTISSAGATSRSRRSTGDRCSPTKHRSAVPGAVGAADDLPTFDDLPMLGIAAPLEAAHDAANRCPVGSRSGCRRTSTAPDPFDGTDALLAQMLATEYELDDREITPRASSIRRGQPHRWPDALDVAAVDEPEPIVAVATTPPSIVEPLPIPALGATDADRDRAPPAPLPATLPAPVRVERPLPRLWSWSAPTLRAFGVPDTVVGRIDRRVPADDLDWIVAFMLAVREVCGSLPDEPAVLAGPACDPSRRAAR